RMHPACGCGTLGLQPGADTQAVGIPRQRQESLGHGTAPRVQCPQAHGPRLDVCPLQVRAPGSAQETHRKRTGTWTPPSPTSSAAACFGGERFTATSKLGQTGEGLVWRPRGAGRTLGTLEEDPLGVWLSGRGADALRPDLPLSQRAFALWALAGS